MFKIVRKEELNPSVSLIEVEAPYIARKAEPGQFIILRIDEQGERVPFTIADYDFASALLASFLIAVVTFVICLGGVIIGKKVGTKLAGKAGIFGGVILIAIGLEIFITSLI